MPISSELSSELTVALVAPTPPGILAECYAEFDTALAQAFTEYTVRRLKPIIAWDSLINQGDDWSNVFGNRGNPAEERERLNAYLNHLYGLMKLKIQWELDMQSLKCKSDRVIDITVIAHGAIRKPFIQSRFHYKSSNVKTVTLYQPWGCKLHGTAAYMIATNRISMKNCRFFFNRFAPPTQWNILPNDRTEVPLMCISPIHPRARVLKYLTRRFKNGDKVDGILYKYVSKTGEIRKCFPLHVLCTLFGIAASEFGATVNIRLAACLDWEDNNSQCEINQYHNYSVTNEPTDEMWCNAD